MKGPVRAALLLAAMLPLSTAATVAAGPAEPPPQSAQRPQDGDALERYLREVPLFVVPADAPYRAELTTAVNRWLDAIARRDAGGILPFVLPEDRESIRGALSDPDNVLYRTLLSEQSRTYRLARSENREVMLLVKGTPLNPGPGVDACVFDRRRYGPQTDEERIRLFREPQAEIACYFFYYGDNDWRFGYDAIMEGGPEAYDPP